MASLGLNELINTWHGFLIYITVTSHGHLKSTTTSLFVQQKFFKPTISKTPNLRFTGSMWMWSMDSGWRHQMETFSRYGRWPVNSPHKGHWRGALMFSLICAWTNGWLNDRNPGDLRRHRAHYDVTVMSPRKERWCGKHFAVMKSSLFL